MICISNYNLLKYFVLSDMTIRVFVKLVIEGITFVLVYGLIVMMFNFKSVLGRLKRPKEKNCSNEK